jgi:hypothetical protein
LGIALQEPAVAEVLLYPRGAGDVVPLKKRSKTK